MHILDQDGIMPHPYRKLLAPVNSCKAIQRESHNGKLLARDMLRLLHVHDGPLIELNRGVVFRNLHWVFWISVLHEETFALSVFALVREFRIFIISFGE